MLATDVNSVTQLLLKSKCVEYSIDVRHTIYATIITKISTQTVPILSESFSLYVHGLVYTKFNEAPTNHELTAIINNVISELRFKTQLPQVELFNRIGVSENLIYTYMLDQLTYVEYGNNELYLGSGSDVKFTVSNLANQVMIDIDDITKDPLEFVDKFFTVDKLQLPTFFAWLLYCFVASSDKRTIYHPILLLSGDSKTGKTKCLNFINRIVSPSISKQERLTNEENIALLASNTYVCVFDDVTNLNASQQKILRQIYEGGTKTVPTKYKDNVPFVINLKSIVVLAGEPEDISKHEHIKDEVISLQLVKPQKMMDSLKLEKEFAEELPNFLLNVFDLLKDIVVTYHESAFSSDSVHSDFIKFGLEVEAHYKSMFDGEFNFMDSYNEVLTRQKHTLVYSNPILNTLLEFSKTTKFESSPTKLNEQLRAFALENDLEFPQVNVNVLTRVINSAKNELSSLGVIVESSRSRSRTIKIVYENLESLTSEKTKKVYDVSEVNYDESTY